MLTQRELFNRVNALGLSITKREGEYRVAYRYPGPLPGGHGRIRRIQDIVEATAYYTDDRDDAYGTAILMAKPDALAAINARFGAC